MSNELQATGKPSNVRVHLLLAMGLAALGIVAVTMVIAEEAEASHFRSGTLYAVPTGGNTVSLQGRIAFRASYPAGETIPPQPPSFPCNVGDIAPGTFQISPIQVTNNAGTSIVATVNGNLK